MAPGPCTRQSPYVNPPNNISKEQDKFASCQNLVDKSYIENNEAFTLLEAPIPLLITPPTKNLFIKFMKIFEKSTKAWDREQLEL